VKIGELVRIYLVNILEFDETNSFHVHGHFFDEYRTGTRAEPNAYTDTVIMGQAERSILEMRFRYPGQFMFHAHKTEFAELGWMGLFEATP
jgi:FtsP/CotA-like multicopper oxidase with cupredoxin domain